MKKKKNSRSQNRGEKSAITLVQDKPLSANCLRIEGTAQCADLLGFEWYCRIWTCILEQDPDPTYYFGKYWYLKLTSFFLERLTKTTSDGTKIRSQHQHHWWSSYIYLSFWTPYSRILGAVSKWTSDPDPWSTVSRECPDPIAISGKKGHCLAWMSSTPGEPWRIKEIFLTLWLKWPI
jgi:hypothetical protein